MRHLLRIGTILGFAVIMAIAAGCARQSPLVIEKPIPVDRLVYVPIDPALTETKPIPAPRDDSGAELLRVARARKADLAICYGKLDSIATVQGTEVPKAAKP